jgi:DHA1 family bicyclomycin/chloramphenicol resistance-like MFS transporter
LNLLLRPVFRAAAAPSLPLLVAVTALGTIGLHMFIPALPATAHALGAPAGLVQMTITLYILGLAVGQSVYGPLSDRHGRRPLLIGGMALYVLASVGAALASDVNQLIAARVVQALGACAGLVLGRAILRDGISTEKAAGAMAMLMTAVTVSPALAPPLGGYLTAWFGWHATFVFLAIAGGALLLAVVLVLPETLRAPIPDASIRSTFASYAKLARLRVFRLYTLGSCCATTSLYGFLSASPFIFVNLLHRPEKEVGLYYLVMFLAVAAGAFASSRLVRRVAPRRLARLGAAVQLVGAAALLAGALFGDLSGEMSGMRGVAMVLGPVVLICIGGGIAGPNASVLAISADPQRIGAASGFFGTLQMVFGALCTAVVSIGPVTSVVPTAILLLAAALTAQVAFARGAKAV